MKFVFYKELIEDAKMIRQKVFVEEQGFENEFDDIDQRSLHLVVYQDNEPIGCARMYPERENMILGRIAVVKEYRALHIGSDILHVLELKAKELNYQTVCLSAQVRAKSFYQKNGYIHFGEEYLDEYCPHVYMKKKIA